MLDAEKIGDAVVSVLDEHSASNIVVLNVADRCQLAEKMIIASGNSSTHVKALVEHVKKRVSPYGKALIEGLQAGNWVILSLKGIVVVHIFRPEARLYYNLEELWGNPQLFDQGTTHPEGATHADVIVPPAI